MPGRDDLVQQNIARAQVNSQSPRPQDRDGKASPDSSGLGAPKSFFGGNYEVYSALETIKFQGVSGDASMRGNTAYIRLWKRGNTSQQTSADIPASQVTASFSDDLRKSISTVQSSFTSTAKLDSYTFDPSIIRTYQDQFKDLAAPNYGSWSNIPELKDRQNTLLGQIPTNASPASNSPSNPEKPPTTSSRTATPSSSALGSVKSANPSGLVNSLANVGRALVGLPASPPAYSGKAGGKNTSITSAPASGEMMWQFLFNPSEIELEAGPEFKNSETWGVSDKANSGQPLHWSHNKNALLKFNSVLLNGFVFGRKVEALEQGLIELFMARDGEGQHGPHVLEFVWGKRVFGPCVIRNINIKEKMWDEGEVVNAELSFTLEQVPEWTINDGFVDVARPGRLMPIGDPVNPDGSASDPKTKTDPNSQNPGPAKKQDQKAKERSKTLSETTCERAYYYAGLFKSYQKKINDVNIFFGSRNDTRRIVTDFLIKFQNAAQELGSSFATTSRATEVYKRTEDILNPNRPGGRLDGGQIKGYVNGYIQEAVNKAGAIYNDSKKCPNTAGATVQPSRPGGGVRGVNTRLSTSTNL